MQIAMMIVLLTILGVVWFRKKKESTPSEVAYHQQLIEIAVYSLPNSAVIITNALNKVVLWNTGAERLFDYKEIDMKGKDLEVIGFKLPETFQENTPTDSKAIRKNQKVIPVSITVSECKVSGTIHYIAIVKDIWERTEREALLRREIELLNWGEKLAGIGSWNWAINSVEMVSDLVMVSEGFNFIFDTDDQFTDVKILMDRVWHEDKDRVFQVMRNAQEKQIDYTVDYRVAKFNGKIFWVRCYGKILLTPNGNTQCIIGTIQKIPDQHANI